MDRAASEPLTRDRQEIILLVGAIEPAYGAARVALDLAQGFAANGFRVRIITHDSADGAAPSGVTRVHVPRGSGPLGWVSFVFRLRRYLRATAAPETPIFGFLTMTNFALVLAVAGTSFRAVATEHNEQSLALRTLGSSGRVALLLMPLMYRGRKVIAVSHAVADDLREKCGAGSARVTVIYNPVDSSRLTDQIARFSRSANDSAISSSRPFVVCVAELKAAKQQALLIRAMKHVVDVDLVLIGDGAMRHDLERLASTHGVQQRVLFAGRSETPWVTAQGARASLLTPTYEGFGLSAAESVIAGIKPIGLRVGGLAEVLERVSGAIIDPTQPEPQLEHEIAEQIERALQNDWSPEQGRRWIDDELAPSTVARRYADYAAASA